ncbi:MAG: hypothetical protein M3Q99_20625, partial [Acidobacteriota bacterium]|nr:hypothetical protein [Acidobacteriota bacterium]
IGLLSVLGFAAYLKRRRKSLETTNQEQFNEPPPYRPLFAPTDEEIRALEREEQKKLEAEQKEAEHKVLSEKSEKVRELEKVWRNKPNKQNTIELLRLAAESESAAVFSQTAENVIQVWHNEQTGGLSKKDLADLLDSHLRILPQQERLSGAVFWIKREIENLRRKSEYEF